jgi:hypothetical protein
MSYNLTSCFYIRRKDSSLESFGVSYRGIIIKSVKVLYMSSVEVAIKIIDVATSTRRLHYSPL